MKIKKRQRGKKRRRRRSIGRSFLLRKSFQNGIHLLGNSSQRKLKLVLQGDTERKEGQRGTLEELKEPKPRGLVASLISATDAAKEPFGKVMDLLQRPGRPALAG